jgi:hypothetical protein
MDSDGYYRCRLDDGSYVVTSEITDEYKDNGCTFFPFVSQGSKKYRCDPNDTSNFCQEGARELKNKSTFQRSCIPLFSIRECECIQTVVAPYSSSIFAGEGISIEDFSIQYFDLFFGRVVELHPHLAFKIRACTE